MYLEHYICNVTILSSLPYLRLIFSPYVIPSKIVKLLLCHVCYVFQLLLLLYFMTENLEKFSLIIN